MTGNPGIASYIASKHGVIGLTRTTALEYVKKRTRVNAVNPGLIDEATARAADLQAGLVLSRHRNPPDVNSGPNHWEIWLRELHRDTVVLASPDGEADGTRGPFGRKRHYDVADEFRWVQFAMHHEPWLISGLEHQLPGPRHRQRAIHRHQSDFRHSAVFQVEPVIQRIS